MDKIGRVCVDYCAYCCCEIKWLEKVCVCVCVCVCVSIMGKLDVSFFGKNWNSCSTISPDLEAALGCLPCLSHRLIVVQFCYSYSYSYSFFTVSVRFSSIKGQGIYIYTVPCLLKWILFFVFGDRVVWNWELGCESCFYFYFSVKRMVVELKKFLKKIAVL